jgi:hypothetical protein
MNMHLLRDTIQADTKQNAYHELTGYPKDPSLNKEYSFLDYCFEDDVELAKDRWSVLMGGTSTTFEMRFEHCSSLLQLLLTMMTGGRIILRQVNGYKQRVHQSSTTLVTLLVSLDVRQISQDKSVPRRTL